MQTDLRPLYKVFVVQAPTSIVNREMKMYEMDYYEVNLGISFFFLIAFFSFSTSPIKTMYFYSLILR